MIPALALRISYVGELGWELRTAMADLPLLYEAVGSGEEHGIADFGSMPNSLRMEKGYRAGAGHQRGHARGGHGALLRDQ